MLSATPLLSLAPSAALAAGPLTHIAMHGDSADLDFTYVNPAAPKGGMLRVGVQGTFDSVNPYALRGALGYGLRTYVYESLLTRYYNAPFTLYALIAEELQMADDRSSIRFFLNPKARFSDGMPLTAQDVLFTYELLRAKGRPNHRAAYGKVKSVTIIDQYTVHFDLNGANDWELPLIIGLMPVLPAHAIQPETFADTLSSAFVGSGPYRLEEVKFGESLILRKNADWWGKDLPSQHGLYHFDAIKALYYRDSTALFEAFKAGLVDFRLELDPVRWATGYDFQAVRDGRITLHSIASQTPKTLNVIAFNSRRRPLDDKRVRMGLTALFDGEWVNRNLFAGRYGRCGSIFEGSELSARNRPADADERALLRRCGSDLAGETLDASAGPPVSDGSGSDRSQLRRAMALFAAAGFRLDNGRLTGPSGSLDLELIVTTREQERIASALSRFAARAGITIAVRLIDAVQFERRLTAYDFDLAPFSWWNNTLSPGNEQAFYWSSQAGRNPGSRNVCGIDDPVVDRLITALVNARSRTELVTAARALDRQLLSQSWWLPLFYVPEQWIALWNHIQMPAESSLFGYLPETWWADRLAGEP